MHYCQKGLTQTTTNVSLLSYGNFWKMSLIYLHQTNILHWKTPSHLSIYQQVQGITLEENIHLRSLELYEGCLFIEYLKYWMMIMMLKIHCAYIIFLTRFLIWLKTQPIIVL